MRPPIRPQRLTITLFVDILITLALFHNFSSWGAYETLSAKIVGAFACIYVLNDWMTTRATFAVYSPRIFATDIITIFLFSNMPNALNDSTSIWGYSPLFWVAVGLQEFNYAFWDKVIKESSPSEEAQKNLTVWAYLSFISTFSALLVGLYQRFETNLVAGHVLSAIPLLYITGMTIKWNWDRFQRAKQEGTSFLA